MSDPVLIPQTPVEEKIRALVEPIAEHRGCELVHVKVSGGPVGAKLCLYFDHKASDGSIAIDELESLNRLIGDGLDVIDAREGLFEGSYELEVSSPGLDRPLAKRSHFESVVGKLIRIKTSGELGIPKTAKVMLRAVTDSGIEVEWEQKKGTIVQVPWMRLREANTVFIFEEKKKPKRK